MKFEPPRPQTLTLEGPVGALEAILEDPGENASRIAVICHPHPLHGGTMTNKVVHTLARTFNQLGVASLRFNYRGVGASAGTYDEGRGETDDAIAVVDWALGRMPGAHVWLAGFSFGGAVALRTATARVPQRLITVAPAAARENPANVQVPDCPWLVVQGGRDDLIDCRSVQEWVAALQPSPTLVVLPEAEHFFHGRLNELRDAVKNWLEVVSSG
jgi:alpha/beta superfamily hydrolase